MARRAARGGGLGVEPPNPDEILGTKLVAWYRADLGVTLDGSTRVSLWENQAFTGAQNDVSNATPGTRPVFEPGGFQGGRDNIRFVNPRTDFLEARGGTFGGTGEYLQMWLVFRTEIVDSGKLYLALLDAGDADVAIARSEFVSKTGQPTIRYFSPQARSGAGPIVSPDAQVLHSTWNDANNQIRWFQNGEQITVTSMVGVQTATTGLDVSRINDAQDTWFAEIMILNSIPTDEEDRALRVYLNSRYAFNMPLTNVAAALAPQCVAWYRADSVSITGSGVDTWFNRAGPSTNDLTQSNDPDRPTVVPSAIDGHPALAFTGGQHLDVTGGDFADVGEHFNVFLVGRTTNLSQNNQTFVRAENGPVVHRLRQRTSDIESRFDDPTGPNTISVPNNDTNFHLYRVQFDGTNHTLYRDGVQIGQIALAGGHTALVDELSVGARSNGSMELEGEIADLFTLCGDVTAQQLADVMVYYKNRYPSLNLP